jgi:hypothetical protein
MSQIYKSPTAGGLPPTVLETITGNDGVPESAIAHNFNFLTANATPQFKGTTGTETLDFGLSNLLLGSDGSITSGIQNTSLGSTALSNLHTGNQNTALGYGAMANSSPDESANVAVGFNAGTSLSGNSNTLVGFQAGLTLASGNTAVGASALLSCEGNFNLALGNGAGTLYTTTESNNVLLNNIGVAGESNVMRLGNQGSGSGQQNKAFVAGIIGVTTSNSQLVTVDSTSGQLGAVSESTLPSLSFAPNAVVNLFEDFFVDTIVATQLQGSLPWTIANSGWALGAAGSISHPGIIVNTSMTSGVRSMILAATTFKLGAFLLGGGVLSLNWVFNIATLSNATNSYTLAVGISDTTSAAAATNGCWVQYSDALNSGNWTFNTASSSTATNSNSSVAVTLGWHNVNITVNANASSVAFSVDGTSLGTITTNIPTSGILPYLNVIFGAGTIAASTIQVDLMYLTQILTTPR